MHELVAERLRVDEARLNDVLNVLVAVQLKEVRLDLVLQQLKVSNVILRVGLLLLCWHFIVYVMLHRCRVLEPDPGI